MKPITMTVRALRRLAKCAGDSSRPHIAAIQFRAADITVTDGHTLVSLPLGKDKDKARRFCVPTRPLLATTEGARPDAKVTIERGKGETRFVIAGSAGVIITIADDAENCGRFPDVDIVIKAERTTEPVSTFHIDGRLMARVGKVARDCGRWITNDAPSPNQPVSIEIIGGALDPVVFTFATEHGTARVYAMPVRR